MASIDTASRIKRAYEAAGLGQRAISERTGISQSTLSRIVSGDRPAKMPEVVSIAWATGSTVAELTGLSGVTERVRCAARATNDTDMGALHRELMHFLELNAYLEDQGIPA